MKKKGKIGVFDSGLGGLIILDSIIKKMPDYDYVYLGDTARVPYGGRSEKVIYEFTLQAVERLFKEGCELVILACNSSSARALRKIQINYVNKKHPSKRVLGVLIPAVESAVKNGGKRIGVIATESTIKSGAYKREINKINGNLSIFEKSTPLLVPLIENNAMRFSYPILTHYLSGFRKNRIDTLILGCTHYPILKDMINKIIGKKIEVISQDNIIPACLRDYVSRHPEINSRLRRKRNINIYLTDITDLYKKNINKWMRNDARIKLINL